MTAFRCDLHIHSALSPCSDEDMTPGNIIGMAILAGLDVVAITDHQSCSNCQAAMAISEANKGPLVIPGIEVQSSEDIHLVCLFPNLETAQSFETQIQASLLPIKNRPDIFGKQMLFNEDDECIGFEDRLLLQACAYSCDQIAADVLNLGGVCIPAHIDRDANSMLATLGAIPHEFPARWLEVSKNADLKKFADQNPDLQTYQILVSSDAHQLLSIEEPGWPIELNCWQTPEQGRAELLAALRPQIA